MSAPFNPDECSLPLLECSEVKKMVEEIQDIFKSDFNLLQQFKSSLVEGKELPKNLRSFTLLYRNRFEKFPHASEKTIQLIKMINEKLKEN